MSRLLILAMLAGTAGAFTAAADDKSEGPAHYYELRTYTAVPGRLANLHARFRDHTVRLFERHGMKVIGFWTPVDKDNTLIYVIQHESAEAAQKSWVAFRADPEWLKVKKASEDEAGGPLTEKVESVFMTSTDYSALQ
jgi:hypothetical protein